MQIWGFCQRLEGELTWGVLWMRLAGWDALRSVAMCITEWTEGRVRWWRGAAALLLSGESDSWPKQETLFTVRSTRQSKLWHEFTADLLIYFKFRVMEGLFVLLCRLNPTRRLRTTTSGAEGWGGRLEKRRVRRPWAVRKSPAAPPLSPASACQSFARRHPHLQEKTKIIANTKQKQFWKLKPQECRTHGDVTVVLQFGILPGTPPLDGPVPKGKHLGADFDDATQSAASRDFTSQRRRA